jgi:hypothetical protein
MDGLDVLQNVCIPLCTSAWCTKLAATLTLMNMCTTHGCSNKFVDELFSMLHKFLLPKDNCLSSNMYGAKFMHAVLDAYCLRDNMQIVVITQNVGNQGSNKLDKEQEHKWDGAPCCK